MASTKRFHRLLARCEQSAELVLAEQVLSTVRKVLGPWCDFPELNLTQGVEVHPGAPEQIPHCDQAMWAAAPKGQMNSASMCSGRWAPSRGRTAPPRVWPGTHARARIAGEPLPDPVVAEIEPGDALLILGSTVHGAGTNSTGQPRRLRSSATASAG
jgi:ectoine hydroxylase-related dioxygenase (phytanoyl-CoA dioxygenase family)